MPSIRVRVPATSANLGPGFDCLGLAFQLYNYVTISESQSETDSISASGEGADTLARDASNIALIAAKRLFGFLNLPDTPIHLHLENAIPLSRGLGSSSAARVGALVAANEWLKRRGHDGVANGELLNLANELEGHPDNVAAALLGGLTVATSQHRFAFKDDPCDVAWREGMNPARARRFPIAVWPQFVAFIPDAHLETKTARGVLADSVSRADAVFNISHTALLLTTLATGDWKTLRFALQDRLHQKQRWILIPKHFDFLIGALHGGALNTTLSGAGPTLLAWVAPDADAAKVASALQEVAQKKNVPGRALELKVDLDGCVPVETH